MFMVVTCVCPRNALTVSKFMPPSNQREAALTVAGRESSARQCLHDDTPLAMQS
jgi:hypothetical protein